jgi:hypothetical protein
MLPGHPRILTCPFCRAEKEVLTLHSGNTIDQRMWSDNKTEAPMLPSVSYVQKCPQCGKFYIITRQEYIIEDSKWGGELGTLGYEDMLKAFHQLKEEGFVDKDEEANVRVLLFHTYNDQYRYEESDEPELTQVDKDLFLENVTWLIQNCIMDELMLAEFYREIGDMKNAQLYLDKFQTEEPFFQKLKDEIQRHILENDARVFEITNL